MEDQRPDLQKCNHSEHIDEAGLARRNTDGWGTDDPNAVAC
jgi:hypothetical protein